MFVQVIKGRTTDAAGLRKEWESWVRESLPGAKSLLGITGGVADDGTFVALVRFESEAKAPNSERSLPSAVSAYLEGEATVEDCTEVHTTLAGGSDDAGFVQVVQLPADVSRRLLEMERDLEKVAADFRPDMIGGLIAFHPDGRSTGAYYFTSEGAAREGEQKEPPAELKAMFDEWLTIVPRATFIDLPDPWLVTP